MAGRRELLKKEPMLFESEVGSHSLAPLHSPEKMAVLAAFPKPQSCHDFCSALHRIRPPLSTNRAQLSAFKMGEAPTFDTRHPPFRTDGIDFLISCS